MILNIISEVNTI